MSHRFGMAAGALVFVCALANLAGPTTVWAQGIDAPTPTGRDPEPTNRLDILAVSLGLTKEQKNSVKEYLDVAHKSAGPVRTRLLVSRAAIVAAIQTGKSQAEIDRTVAAHGTDITAMTQLEMKALAQVLAMLTPEQQAAARTSGIRRPFFLIRNIFLDEHRWNVEPTATGY